MYEQEGIRNFGKEILAARQWQKILGRSGQATRNLTVAGIVVLSLITLLVYLFTNVAFAQAL